MDESDDLHPSEAHEILAGRSGTPRLSGFFVFLIIFIIFLSSIIIIFFKKYPTSKPNVDSSAKLTDLTTLSPSVFTDTYRHYSLTLPPGWAAKTFNENSDLKYVYLTDPDNKSDFFIGTEDLIPGLIFSQNAEYWIRYYSGSTSGLGNYQPQVAKKEPFITSGLNGVKYTLNYSDHNNKNGTAVWIYLPFSKYKLLEMKFDSVDPQILDQYNRILSTFKYFAPTPTPQIIPLPSLLSASPPPYDWITYDDPGHLYTFKYPPNFQKAPNNFGLTDNLLVSFAGPTISYRSYTQRPQFSIYAYAKDTEECYTNDQTHSPIPDRVIINNSTYHFADENGAGAGMHTHLLIYRTMINHQCFSVETNIIDSADWNDQSLFKMETAYNKFQQNTLNQILSTFKFYTSSTCYTDPQKTLTNFLTFLHAGQYIAAAALFDDSLSNHENSTSDTLKRYCEGYLTCLKFKITSQTIIPIDSYSYTVIFFNDDGTPFVQVPPMNPHITPEPTPKDGTPILFKVTKTGGCYKTHGLPPITP